MLDWVLFWVRMHNKGTLVKQEMPSNVIENVKWNVNIFSNCVYKKRSQVPIVLEWAEFFVS